MIKFRSRRPHDSYFKIFFSHKDMLRLLLDTYVPSSLLSLCDLNALTLVSPEFVSERLHSRVADLVYRTHLVNQPDSYIYFLIEHQRRPDKRMPQRLWEYTSRLILEHERRIGGELPLVYPMVLYNGTRPYPGDLDIWRVFKEPDLAKEWMTGKALLIDLNRIPDETIHTHGALALFEYLQKHSSTQSSRTVVETFSRLQRTLDPPLDISSASWQYILNTTQEVLDFEALQDLIDRHFNDTKEHMMTLAQQLRRWGYEEGVQEGIHEGIQKGIDEGIQTGMQRGIQKGIQESTRVIAKNMLLAGASVEFIVQVTGLSEDEVQALSGS